MCLAICLPGWSRLCVHAFPHIRVWTCVPVPKPVSSRVIGVITLCVCAHIFWSGSAVLPCVCIRVSEQVEMGPPVLCVMIPWPLFMASMMETEIYVVVVLVLAPLSPPWRWRGSEICSQCSCLDSGLGLSLAPCPGPCPHHLPTTVPFLSSLPRPCLLSLAILSHLPNPLVLASKPTCASS